MRKMRPEMLEKRQKTLDKIAERKDITLANQDDERHVVSGILTEQGLMTEGGKTIIHDRVAYGDAYALGEARDMALN